MHWCIPLIIMMLDMCKNSKVINPPKTCLYNECDSNFVGNH